MPPGGNSSEQLVAEHAEAVERGGLGAEDDGAERDRAATAALRERAFGGVKIAFGPDQDQHFLRAAREGAQHLAERDRVRLQRRDQQQIVRIQRREKLLQLARLLHLQQAMMCFF